MKSSDASFVVDAVRTVAAGIAHVVLRRIAAPGAREGSSPLTTRERDVLRLIADGVGNAEMATRLNVSLGTIKGHVEDILEKLSASDRAHAAVTAFRRGYIS